MNIAIISDTYFPDINGVTSSISTLSESLRDMGHNVYIFTVSEPHQIRMRLKKDSSIYRFPSIPIFFIKPHRAASPFSARLFRLMRQLKIDVIHTQTEFFMGFVGMNAAHALRIPIVHTYHTMLEDYTHYVARGNLATPKMAQAYSRFFCNLADSVIVPTAKVKKTLISYGVKRPIFTIATGIDLEPFRISRFRQEEVEELKKQFGITAENIVILCLGRVAKEKSIDMMIDVMPQLTALHKNIRLLVVGGGPALSSLKGFAAKKNIADKVIFTGAAPYSKVSKYYQMGDIFVSCSITETQGLTYYEAMASGLPVVARMDESVSSLLNDGKNARLFRTKEELTQVLSDLISNPEQLRTYSQNASTSVQEYSASVFAERVLSVYSSTIDRKRLYLESNRPVSIRSPVSKALRKVKLVMPAPPQFRHKDR